MVEKLGWGSQPHKDDNDSPGISPGPTSLEGLTALRDARGFSMVDHMDDGFSSGFFVIHRQMFDHPLWLGLTVGQRMVMITCIEMACWKDSRFWSRLKKREIEVPRGSFISTQQRIADRAGVTRRVVRGALDQLEAAKFVRRSEVGRVEGHRLTLITVVNYCKYQDTAREQGHGKTVAVPQQYRSGTVAGALYEQGNKGNKETATTGQTGQLLPDPIKSPLAEAAVTADHLRRLLLDSGLSAPGLRTDVAFSRRRLEWARTLRAAEVDLERSQGQMRDLMTWVFEAAPTWEVDDRVWSWPEVLACGEPAKKWVSKLQAIESHRARSAKSARSRLRAVPYSPGPGAPIISTSYYDGDREISREEYDRRTQGVRR